MLYEVITASPAAPRPAARGTIPRSPPGGRSGSPAPRRGEPAPFPPQGSPVSGRSSRCADPAPRPRPVV